MRATSGEPGITFTDEIPASPTARSRRAAEPFAGLPMAQAALGSPEHATPGSAGRSTTRRSSTIRSRWVGFCVATASRTKSSPPACSTTRSKRPRPPAPSCAVGLEPGSRASSSRFETTHRSATMSPASATCATGSRRQTPTRTRSSPRTSILIALTAPVAPAWSVTPTAMHCEYPGMSRSFEPSIRMPRRPSR